MEDKPLATTWCRAFSASADKSFMKTQMAMKAMAETDRSQLKATDMLKRINGRNLRDVGGIRTTKQ
jgi:hypothetical protein